DPIVQEKEVTEIDQNIQLPAYVFAYRVPGNKEKDAYTLDMLSSYLSDRKSSVLKYKLIDQDKKALDVGILNTTMEDYGVF
ncbi:hypothetical protein R2R70_22490, partial [Cobetia sp. SIMBA_158]|uniref:insulinase family protein n=1 Tax=Cobetia sp. SIMBA_158 TaxID=3081617 RepID=UPI00397FC7EF